MDEKIVALIMGEVKRRLCEMDRNTIPVELSARHVHLSQKDSLELFGGPLTFKRELSQPGQYLSEQRVRLIGPRGVIDNVAILGPERSQSQVEISISDSRSLGLDVPIRQSGDIKGTPGIVLASSKGIVGLKQGVIVAGRHIHMTPKDAECLGVKDHDLVCVSMTGKRPVMFRDVLVRVSSDFELAMHIDFDEGNGSGWTKDSVCTIVKKNQEEFCGA